MVFLLFCFSCLLTGVSVCVFSPHPMVCLRNAVQVIGYLNLLTHLTSPIMVLLHNFV